MCFVILMNFFTQADAMHSGTGLSMKNICIGDFGQNNTAFLVEAFDLGVCMMP